MPRPALQILLCTLICSVSCLLPGSMTASAADKTVSLVFASQPLSSPGGTLVALMKRDRILRRELARTGITLQVVPVKKGSDAIAMLKTGAAHMATLGDMPLLEAAANMPLSVIARSRFSYVSLVGERGSLAKDLKGKRIGYAPGTSGHFALLKILVGAGLNETDVKLAPMDVTEMGASLLQKKIDAFSTWEPTPEAVISANPDRFAVICRQATVSHLVVLGRTAERHPELRFQLAAALIRATNWVTNNRSALNQAADWTLEDMRALSGAASPMNRDQMAGIIMKELQALNHSQKIPLETVAESSSLAEELLFLKKQGKLPPDATWDAIRAGFDFKVMEQVMKQPKIYQLTRYDYEQH